MSKVRRLGVVALGALLLVAAPVPASAQQAKPSVSLSSASDLDPAGQKITIKGTAFDPKFGDGKGYGVRIGPQRTGWRDKATTTFTQYSKLLKENWQFGIDLKPDGTWQTEVTVKASYTAGGETISAANEQFYVMIFPWDNPDTSKDIVIPLKFKAAGKPLDGALNWGIKASWRGYIARGGTITPSQGAAFDNAGTPPLPYVWPFKSASFDPRAGKGEVQFSGKVNFAYEAHTIWDYGLANPKIVINPDGKGVLHATVNTAFYGTKAQPEKVFGPKEIAYADLVFDGKPVVSGRSVTVKIKSAALTEDGAAAFAGFYPKGTEVDAGTVTFTADVPAECEASTQFDKGDLVWGFKRSFRQYVGNGSGNSIKASGGAAITDIDVVPNQNGVATGAHRYPFKSAKYTSDTKFEVVFGGMISFDYPAHLFTVHLGNPRVVADGKTGSLFADVELTAKEGAPGKPAKLTGVELAKLNLDAAKATNADGVVTIAGVAATLASSEAFAGFYAAGDKLDTMTITLGAACSSLPPPASTPPAGATEAAEDLVPPLNFRPAELANTGVNPVGLLTLGALLLMSGAGMVYFGRGVKRT